MLFAQQQKAQCYQETSSCELPWSWWLEDAYRLLWWQQRSIHHQPWVCHVQCVYYCEPTHVLIPHACNCRTSGCAGAFPQQTSLWWCQSLAGRADGTVWRQNRQIVEWGVWHYVYKSVDESSDSYVYHYIHLPHCCYACMHIPVPYHFIFFLMFCRQMRSTQQQAHKQRRRHYHKHQREDSIPTELKQDSFTQVHKSMS